MCVCGGGVSISAGCMLGRAKNHRLQAGSFLIIVTLVDRKY